MAEHRHRAGIALTLALTLLVTFTSDAFARRGEAPLTTPGTGLPNVATLRVQAPDVDMLRAENDAARVAGEKTLRFAEAIAVSSTPANDGRWETLADGTRLWRLAVVGAGATDINLGFASFELPLGAKLWAISAAHDVYEGPYTWEDNAAHGQLWLPVVPGDALTLELQVPADVKFEPHLHLTQVGYGFVDLFGVSDLARRVECNLDVICPEGDPWRDAIGAVAIYSFEGTTLCTGQMVMDAEESFRPFFLTAYHCGIDAGTAPSMVVYWNYESSVCGQRSGGSLAQNQTGAIFRAGRQDVDVALVELEELPDPSFGVFHSGWDRSGTPPQSAVAIHHANNAEKAISLDDDPLTVQTSCIGAFTPDTHWRVGGWELGTTEPGSSGGGLWDPASGLLVGFLSGGLAACGNQEPDCFGRFDVAWDGPDPQSRLRDWLDPNGIAGTQVQGSYPAARVVLADVRANDQCSGVSDGVIAPGETVELDLALVARFGDVTGITVTLATSTPGVTVITGGANYPDALQDSTVVNTTPFVFDIDASVPCFDTIDLVATLDAAGAATVDVPFSLPVGQAAGPAELPVAIPDGVPAGVTSDLAVAQNVLISDLKVSVRIEHGYVGDLRIQLRSPSGTVVTLLDRPGFPATAFGCGDDDLDVTFDDDAAQDLESLCTGNDPWFAGTALPSDPLAAFDGEVAFGTWSLIVSDETLTDPGVLVDWSLDATPPLTPGVCVPCSTTPIATVSTGAPLPVSIFVVPDGSGDRLDDAPYRDLVNGGPTTRVDATLLVDVTQGDGGPPAVGVPATDVTLTSTQGNLVPCATLIADGPSDVNGRMTFSGALPAGGRWVAGERLVVNGSGFDPPTGPPSSPDNEIDVRFTSADFDGNGAVDLIDVGNFATAFFGPYSFAIDYAYDGVNNVADVGRFAEAVGAACADASRQATAVRGNGWIELQRADGRTGAPNPGTPIRVRVVLHGDAARRGLDAWEAAWESSPNVRFDEAVALDGLDLVDGPDFVVGGDLRSDESALILATLRLTVTDADEAWIRLGPGSLSADGAADPSAVVRGEGLRTIESRELRFADDRVTPVPRVFTLANRPNPFNPATEITLALPRAGEVELRIFDAAGRRVTRMPLGRHGAGSVSATWRGLDDDGSGVVSGVYFVRAFVDGRDVGATHKMMLLK